LHLRFFQAVPNYFVGTGLILTFVGLAAALFFATQGLNQADPALARQGLEKMLGAATFKFLTSIAGIVSSICIAFTYRFVSSGLEKKFDILCDRLESRLEAVTPESIAYDQYRELKKQSAQLERFNTDLAFSIATELDKLLNETLRANIAQVIEPIAKTLDTMSGRFGEMNQDALQRMLGDFRQQLQGAAGTELTNLAATLGAAVGPLRQLAETVDQSQQQIKGTLDAAAKSLRETAAAMRASIEGGARDSMNLLTESIGRISTHLTSALSVATSQMSTQLTDAGERAAMAVVPATNAVSGIVQNIELLQGALDKQTQGLTQLQTQLLELVGSTSKAAEDMRAAGEPSQEAARRMLTVTDALGKASESVARSHIGINDLVQRFAKNREDLLKEWERYATRFEGVDRDLANTFQKFEDGARQYQSSVREFFLSMDKELQTALSSLGGGIEVLGDNVEELGEVMDTHVKALRQMRGNLEVTE
jgi:ABC-type transporter Mla subunit MlaD